MIYQIEKAVPELSPLLTQLAIDSNGYWNYRNVSEEEIRNLFFISEEMIEKGVFKVMKNGLEVIGFFGLVKEQQLHAFFLAPSYIGKGYGKLLWNEAIAEAKKQGWQQIEFESDPFAAPFYRKMGAVEIPEKVVTCPLNSLYQSPRFVFKL